MSCKTPLFRLGAEPIAQRRQLCTAWMIRSPPSHVQDPACASSISRSSAHANIAAEQSQQITQFLPFLIHTDCISFSRPLLSSLTLPGHPEPSLPPPPPTTAQHSPYSPSLDSHAFDLLPPSCDFSLSLRIRLASATTSLPVVFPRDKRTDPLRRTAVPGYTSCEGQRRSLGSTPPL
jgi:hypothetical protein